MATEWYLLKSPYAQLSGFESDAFEDFSEEGFFEALESSIAVNVEYCNPDLSICTPMRAIVQKNVQDTKLQTFNRHLLTPIGTCKAGNYIKYKNRFWLISGLVDDNGMYEKSVLQLCNWKLVWLNNNGEVIERWVSIQSASQYNNGQRANHFYTLRTDQLLICLPDDNESLLLDEGMRFIIDRRIDVYNEMINDDKAPYTNFKLITYQVTRNDTALYDYIDSGHNEVLVTQDEQNATDGYYVINNEGYWVCPEMKHSSIDNINVDSVESDSATAKIIGDDDKLYIGLGASEFTAVFYNENGQIVEMTPQWNIDCDFSDKLEIDYINNTICISTNDSSLLNKSFELSLQNGENCSITVKVVGLI